MHLYGLLSINARIRDNNRNYYTTYLCRKYSMNRVII